MAKTVTYPRAFRLSKQATDILQRMSDRLTYEANTHISKTKVLEIVLYYADNIKLRDLLHLGRG